jgi:hypothetical protein
MQKLFLVVMLFVAIMSLGCSGGGPVTVGPNGEQLDFSMKYLGHGGVYEFVPTSNIPNILFSDFDLGNGTHRITDPMYESPLRSIQSTLCDEWQGMKSVLITFTVTTTDNKIYSVSHTLDLSRWYR